MSNNKINNYCLICGKGYHVCNSCREVKDFTPWRTVVDTVNCFQIYTTLSDYNAGVIDTDKAREQLQNCDLSEKNSFKNLYNVFNNRYIDVSDRIEKYLKSIQVLDVCELCDLYLKGDYNSLIKRIRIGGYAIHNVQDKKKLQEAIQELVSNKNLSLCDAVEFAKSKNLIK